MSPAETFDISKAILVISLIKSRWNNEIILRNFELFIYGDIQYTSNLFLKRSAQVATKYVMNLWALLQNYEKRRLASTRLSVCLCLCVYPSAWNISAQTGGIFTKFNT